MKTFPNALGHVEAAPTPVGQPCVACRVPIKDGDVGVLMPHIDVDGVTEEPWHRRCFLASIGIYVADA